MSLIFEHRTHHEASQANNAGLSSHPYRVSSLEQLTRILSLGKVAEFQRRNQRELVMRYITSLFHALFTGGSRYSCLLLGPTS